MTPIERAARALCENPSEDPDELIAMSDGKTIPRWQAELWRVRAVISAIREPSEAMIDAGCGVDDHALGRYNPPNVWRAMIDALLEEGK